MVHFDSLNFSIWFDSSLESIRNSANGGDDEGGEVEDVYGAEAARASRAHCIDVTVISDERQDERVKRCLGGQASTRTRAGEWSEGWWW